MCLILVSEFIGPDMLASPQLARFNMWTLFCPQSHFYDRHTHTMEIKWIKRQEGLSRGRGCYFIWGGQRSFCDKVIFEQRPEGSKRVSSGNLEEEHYGQNE